MAETARHFEDHRAVELIVPSSDPSTHKRVDRGLRNFETAVWDREKRNAVLSGNCAKFTQNPAMKLHLLSTGNKRLAKASPLDSVWGIGLYWSRGGRPLHQGPTQVERKTFARLGTFCRLRNYPRQRGRVATPGLPSSLPQPHRECWNPRRLVGSAVAPGGRGRR